MSQAAHEDHGAEVPRGGRGAARGSSRRRGSATMAHRPARGSAVAKRRQGGRDPPVRLQRAGRARQPERHLQVAVSQR